MPEARRVITTLGLVAALLTTGAWIPQVRKTLATRSAHDFSWAWMVAFGSGVATWAVYGILREDVVIVGANLVTAALLAAIFAVKIGERGAPAMVPGDAQPDRGADSRR
jgi:MtN3 and saliva related transmembrane protein